MKSTQDLTIKDTRLNTDTAEELCKIKEELDKHAESNLMFFMKQVRLSRSTGL